VECEPLTCTQGSACYMSNTARRSWPLV